MAAGVVRALGINMGERAGLNHEDPLFLTDERDRLLNRIRMRNAQEEVWGFKVPKATMMLDFYEQYLRNPYYVVVYRNPLAIIDSWLQRGTNSPVGVMERIMAYQNATFEFLQKTKSPVLMLNYERAVQGAGAKEQTVELMAQFLGIEMTDDLRARAVGMMTGDGHGYVNLPEHFFAVTPAPAGTQAGAELAMVETPDARDAKGWVTHAKVAPRLIYTPADGGTLPKTFILEMEFDDAGTMKLDSNPLRMYFNFIGEYFPGHCARPPVRVGTNRYQVETSGLARSMAFGPMETDVRFKLNPRFFAAVPAK
jgi:hypothetical protein